MLILASQSPRRMELLHNAGIAFAVRAPNIDESLRPSEVAADYVRRLAQVKALTVLAHAPSHAVVLGADTAVVVDGEVLGKPADEDDARRMLARLSGCTHQVMTGVCLAWRNANGETESLVECESTEVEFTTLSAEEIAAYVASGEPMDKAGAYAIQGRASRWIPRIQGCYFNVVGLPVARVWSMLAQAAERGAKLSLSSKADHPPAR
jgi:septum formation protein